MSFSSYEILKESLPTTLQPLKHRIVAANGGCLDAVGVVSRVPVNVPTIPNPIVHDIIVIRNLRKPFLIGADFLSKHLLNVYANGHLEKCQEIVCAKEAKTIPARTEAMIKIDTKRVDDLVLFTPTQQLAVSSINRCDKDSNIWVLLQNNTNEDIRINRKQEFGIITPITESQVCGDVRAPLLTKCVGSLIQSDKPSSQVRISHLPSQIGAQVKALIDAYPDVFSLDPNSIGYCDVIPQEILLKNEKDIACTPPYRIAPNLQPIVNEYVDKLYNAKIIQKSTSPFNSPLMLVKKAGSNVNQPLVEQYRVVHDFRRLNGNTIRDSYPLHNLYDLIDKVASAKVWSVIDLASGFWNQALHKRSRPYTAFSVPGKGHYEYTRTAQGLTNSPATFQRLLDFVVKGIPGVYVYIDDVVIATNTMAEHIVALRQVLDRFRKYNLKCRPKKVQLVTAEINYLGYNLTQEHGIRAGQAKINAIKTYKSPQSQTEVRQFLGLCSFFRRTIPNFATKAQPLTKLTRKDSTWTKGALPSEAAKAFCSLKSELISRPCLKPPDFSQEFILTVDASSVGLGAILSQKHRGIEHPVAYGSRALNDTEKKYAPFRLEYLALVWGCSHFKPYLLGKHFTVRTDHKPLLSFNKEKGSVFDRYLLELSEFDFSMEYLAGNKMPADSLSRQYEVTELVGLSEYINIGKTQLQTLQKQDKFIKALAIYLKYGSLPQNVYLRQYVTDECKHAKIADNIVLRGNAAYAPKGLQTNLIRMAHDVPTAGHYSVTQTLHKLQGWYWPNMGTDVEVYVKSCTICQSNNYKRPNTFPLQPLTPATDFNHRVHIDLLGPLPNNSGMKYVLVMVDAYSSFLQLAASSSKEMHEISQLFYQHWISVFGPCNTLCSDQGTEMKNALFKVMTKNFGITHHFSSVAHPQSNGLAERQVQTVLQYVRKYVSGNEWSGLLGNIQFAHNTNVTRGIGYSPYEAVFGRACVLPTSAPITRPVYNNNAQIELYNNLQTLRADISKNRQPYFKAMKDYYDKRAKFNTIHVGDKVTLIKPKQGKQFQKFQTRYASTYTVQSVSPLGVTTLKALDGSTVKKAHVNNLRLIPFLSAFPDFETTFAHVPRRGANGKTQALPSLGNFLPSPRPLFDDDDKTPVTIPPPHSFPSPLSSPSIQSPRHTNTSESGEESSFEDEFQDAEDTGQGQALSPSPLKPGEGVERRQTRSQTGGLPREILSRYPKERQNPLQRMKQIFSPRK